MMDWNSCFVVEIKNISELSLIKASMKGRLSINSQNNLYFLVLRVYSQPYCRNTPLQRACEVGNYAGAQMLLKYYKQVPEGEFNPARIAKANGHKKLSQLMYLYYFRE